MFVHQYLKDKAKGEVDVVKRANAPVGGAQEHFAVQQDGSVNQVEAQEHEHGQQQLHVQQGLIVVTGNTERSGGGGVGVEVHLPVRANWMDDTNQQLQGDHKNPVTCYSYSPVHLLVINDEQLEGGTDRERNWWKLKKATWELIKMFCFCWTNVCSITCKG